MPQSSDTEIQPARTIHRHYDLEAGILPYPATKLSISQYTTGDPESPDFACIAIGTFYDCDDNIVWTSERFAIRVEPVTNFGWDQDEAQSGKYLTWAVNHSSYTATAAPCPL